MIELAARRLLLRQMNQIGPDLSRAEKIRRFAKMAGEVNDLRDIQHVACSAARLRICMSSIMRRRSGLMDNSFAR